MWQFWKQVLERKQLQKDNGIPFFWQSDLGSDSIKALDDL